MDNCDEYKRTVLKWGKYKGVVLQDIPTNYIEWASNNWFDRGIRFMFEVELYRRKLLDEENAATNAKPRT